MIFKATYQQVLDGTKTQTRRPVKEGEELFWIDAFGKRIGTPEDYEKMGYPDHRPAFSDLAVVKILRVDGHIYLATGKVCPHQIKWMVDRTYAVQPGRGKKAVGRIRIGKIRREQLYDIDGAGFVAEGIDSRKPFILALFDFMQLWDSCYRKPYDWASNPEVWVLEFEVIGKEQP